MRVIACRLIFKYGGESMSVKMTKSEYVAFVKRLYGQLDSIAEQIDLKLSARYEKDLKRIINRAIDNFYSSYHPKYYSRKFSLRYMYKLTPNGASVDMDFGGEFTHAHHRLDNEKLFNLTFIEGYHGGAPGIDEKKVEKWGAHPNPGVPYYRTPYPEYTEWGYRAVKSKAPMDLIDDAIDAYNGTVSKIQREIATPIIKKWIWG